MAFSTQNKAFLSLLRNVDIDLKQFPDQSFDGLFDNVPKDINYFFNWFLENIGVDNVLTDLEQGTYYELEKNNLLPTEDEMNFTLSICSPTYRDLQSLEMSYVNGYLLEDLQDLNKSYKNLNDVCSNLESNHCEIKRKYISIKGNVSGRKKQFSEAQKKSSDVNLLFSSKLDNANKFLLNVPCNGLNMDLYRSLLLKEDDISSKLFKNESFSSLDVSQFTKLVEDLACVEAFLLFSQGLLKSKKMKIKFLTSLFQDESSQKSFDESFNTDFISFSPVKEKGNIKEKINEIQVLEDMLIEKITVISNNEVQKIINQCMVKELDLNELWLSKLLLCQEYVKSMCFINSWCQHMVTRCVNDLKKIFDLRKEFYSLLRRTETNFNNNIHNFELRRQRFKEVSSQHSQHPFLLEVKNFMDLNENPRSSAETLENITELMTSGNDDLNFVSHKFRIDLKSSTKSLFNDVLCGPTSQLVFTPIDLLIKFQNCELREGELSHEIKRLVNKYVDAKEIVSKSDRRKLLLWMDFLTDPETLRLKLKTLEEKS